MTTPVMLDALGKDGYSILAELQGASPRGLVRSESANPHLLLPGQLIRCHICQPGGWCVLLTVAHYGVTGRTYVELANDTAQRLGRVPAHSTWFSGPGSVEVRTDVTIDPETLYKLTK